MLEPDLQRQYDALTQGCGFAALPRTLLEARGKDRISFLNSFCTNDVKGLAAGQGCEAFVTSHQGKVLGHVFVHCESERLIIDTVSQQAQTLTGHFDRFVISEDIQFRDLSSDIGTLIVAGPKSADVLQRLVGDDLPRELFDSRELQIAGIAATVRRIEYAGEHSYFIQAAAERLAALGAALRLAGALVCSESALEIARVEAGFPLFGHDIGEDNLPQEVGRDRQAISFKKGCYLGQETVARIDALGHVNRILRGVKFDGREVPAAGTALTVAGKEAGRVTSAVWSPQFGSPLGLAYVKRAQAAAGTQLASDVGSAVAVLLPQIT